jgi:mannose-6-phosphate isomerase
VVDAPVRIEPAARAYAWGSTTAIPRLIGASPSGLPVAELWFGAHCDSPASTADGPLDAVIASDPAAHLGHEVASAFAGQLPFLLKVLAAEHALSIQVHPTLAQARAGFAAEQARGIAANAPDRNYRDPNHKPELLCALTEFDALCGFRPVADTARLLAALEVTALAPVQAALAGPDPLRRAFQLLLDWPQPARASLVGAVAVACAREADWGGEWELVGRAAIRANGDFPGDIGVVLTLLLNAVRLQPGEAIFLGAGKVHAYLQGMGIEIMANSDNVLRCGLTPKHVDVAEVMRIADFSPLIDPHCPIEVISPGVRTFRAPVRDFALSVLTVPAAGDDPRSETSSATTSSSGAGPQVLLCTDGAVGVGPIELAPGQAVFVPAGAAIALTGHGTLFRATTGVLAASSAR